MSVCVCEGELCVHFHTTHTHVTHCDRTRLIHPVLSRAPDDPCFGHAPPPTHALTLLFWSQQ